MTQTWHRNYVKKTQISLISCYFIISLACGIGGIAVHHFALTQLALSKKATHCHKRPSFARLSVISPRLASRMIVVCNRVARRAALRRAV